MIRKRNLRNRVSSRNSNRRLYESIMKDIAKKVKRVLNEVRSSRYIDSENNRFIGNKEGYPYHEYVTKDRKLHRHNTFPWASSASSRAYGDELEPIDYDGRYDNDEMFKKFMGQPYNEDRFSKEDDAYKIIQNARKLVAWEGESLLRKYGISSKRAYELWRGDIQVEDLTDEELELF